MQVVTHAETKQRDIQTKEYLTVVRPYYGSILETFQGPQAFLVDMPEAGATIHPHFHDIDQFQVIVRGDGRLGPGHAEPVAFHYADAYTPYGPIVGAKDGISFYTIRAACSTGYFPMPEARKLIPGKPGRNIAGMFDIKRPLPAAGQYVREVLLEGQLDRVLVVGLRMGAGASAAGEPTDGGDQYYLVCTGSLVQDGRELPPLTLVRLERGEKVPQFTAGANGAQVLLLQLPMATERIGSDPAKLAKREFGSYSIPKEMLNVN
jgi:hypothetical protein